MIPAIDNPAGAWIEFGSMIPSFPSCAMSPGRAASTAEMMAFQAVSFPASHSAATENPSSTPANTLNRAR